MGKVEVDFVEDDFLSFSFSNCFWAFTFSLVALFFSFIRFLFSCFCLSKALSRLSALLFSLKFSFFVNLDSFLSSFISVSRLSFSALIFLKLLFRSSCFTVKLFKLFKFFLCSLACPNNFFLLILNLVLCPELIIYLWSHQKIWRIFRVKTASGHCF